MVGMISFFTVNFLLLKNMTSECIPATSEISPSTHLEHACSRRPSFGSKRLPPIFPVTFNPTSPVILAATIAPPRTHRSGRSSNPAKMESSPSTFSSASGGSHMPLDFSSDPERHSEWNPTVKKQLTLPLTSPSTPTVILGESST